MVKQNLIIEIPEYPEEIQISNSRRPIYYKKVEDIPKKYQDKSRYVMKKGKLFDNVEKKFLIRNSASRNKPRFQQIAGNSITYDTMHPVIRSKMVRYIKDFYKSFFPNPENVDIQYPLQIECEVHNVPRFANWDIDNLWIYMKCFQDALVESGIIKEDNIQYIVDSGRMIYIPVKKSKDRKLKFIISTAGSERFRYSEYNLFNHSAPKNIYNYDDFKNYERDMVFVETTENGKANDVSIFLEDKNRITINVGKGKVVKNASVRCMGKVYSLCMQFNLIPTFEKKVFEEFESQIRSKILSPENSNGLNIIIK